MIDSFIQKLLDGQYLENNEIKEILVEESNVQSICGDIHGQFYDLLQLFKTAGGLPPASNFIFMLFGFYHECISKYRSAEVWNWFTSVFDYMGLCAVVEEKYFCVHGGLSPSIKTLDQIRVVERFQEIPQEGPFCDLLWSDPEEVGTWASNTRGAGYLFGHKVSAQFNHINGLNLICRAHQLVHEGFSYLFPENSVCTVWSAPNYCYRCGNLASILKIGVDLSREFRIFKEDDQQDNYNSYY